jgi:hypothetical protein
MMSVLDTLISAVVDSSRDVISAHPLSGRFHVALGDFYKMPRCGSQLLRPLAGWHSVIAVHTAGRASGMPSRAPEKEAAPRYSMT